MKRELCQSRRIWDGRQGRQRRLEQRGNEASEANAATICVCQRACLPLPKCRPVSLSVIVRTDKCRAWQRRASLSVASLAQSAVRARRGAKQSGAASSADFALVWGREEKCEARGGGANGRVCERALTDCLIRWPSLACLVSSRLSLVFPCTADSPLTAASSVRRRQTKPQSVC